MPRGWWDPVPGEWPSTFARSVWFLALSLPRPPVPWGGQPGPRYPCFPGAVCVGVGTQQRPHSVRSCELASRAVRVAGRHPRREVPRAVVRGRLGLGARPPLAARPWGGRLRPVAHLLWARVCGRGCTAHPWGGGPGLGVCGGSVVVRCVLWCRGACWCLPSSVNLVPPSLALPPGVLRAVACGCAAFFACAPRSGASLALLARYPPSSFLVAAFFTHSSTLRWFALLPGVHFSLPLLCPCVRLGFFLCLLPRSLGPLCRVWPRLFISFTPSWSCETKEGWGFGLL